MRTFGALRAQDIEALISGPQRDAALRYLAACSRLMAALEPFVPSGRGPLTWTIPTDYVARGVAAALAACRCTKQEKEGAWRSSGGRSNCTMRRGHGAGSTAA